MCVSVSEFGGQVLLHRQAEDSYRLPLRGDAIRLSLALMSVKAVEWSVSLSLVLTRASTCLGLFVGCEEPF